jgi:hypothetical protein
MATYRLLPVYWHDSAAQAGSSRLPTRKWWAVLTSGGFTIAAHAVGSEGWDGPEWAELLTLCSGLTMSYCTKNHPNECGLPPRRKSRVAEIPSRSDDWNWAK